MEYLIAGNQVMHSLIYDIECVPMTETYEELEEKNPQLAEGWLAEAKNIRYNRPTLESGDMSDGELYEEYGGLYPEFGKVVAISTGIFHTENDEFNLYVKTMANDDERVLLEKLRSNIESVKERKKNVVLGGYNIKIYDNPFLAKRYMINGLYIPEILNNVGKKPWEISDLDLAELWQLGKFDKLVKFDIMCGAFGIESPKIDMDGSEVSTTYYDEELERSEALTLIGNYCRQDVIATAHLFLKYAGRFNLEFETIDY